MGVAAPKLLTPATCTPGVTTKLEVMVGIPKSSMDRSNVNKIIAFIMRSIATDSKVDDSHPSALYWNIMSAGDSLMKSSLGVSGFFNEMGSKIAGSIALDIAINTHNKAKTDVDIAAEPFPDSFRDEVDDMFKAICGFDQECLYPRVITTRTITQSEALTILKIPNVARLVRRIALYMVVAFYVGDSSGAQELLDSGYKHSGKSMYLELLNDLVRDPSGLPVQKTKDTELYYRGFKKGFSFAAAKSKFPVGSKVIEFATKFASSTAAIEIAYGYTSIKPSSSFPVQLLAIYKTNKGLDIRPLSCMQQEALLLLQDNAMAVEKVEEVASAEVDYVFSAYGDKANKINDLTHSTQSQENLLGSGAAAKKYCAGNYVQTTTRRGLWGKMVHITFKDTTKPTATTKVTQAPFHIYAS
jgi:hypothetical protein